jgi:hypothetical protein
LTGERFADRVWKSSSFMTNFLFKPPAWGSVSCENERIETLPEGKSMDGYRKSAVPKTNFEV